MRQRQYFRANINGLIITNLEPLRFEHVTLRKEVAYYKGLFGRLITVENGNPTNTLEEATTWLTDIARKHPNMEFLEKETVPYIDESSIHSIDMTEEEAKQLKKRNSKKH